MSTYKLTSSFSRSWFSSPEEAVGALVSYGVDKELVVEDDRIFVTNALLDVLKLEPGPDFDPLRPVWYGALEDILAYLLDDAVSRGVCEDGTASRDLFDTRIMGCITPPPSMVRYLFGKYRLFFGTKATDFLYKLAQDSDYIRTYRVRKNRTWASDTRYGKLDITINLSKPEKDPRAIAAASS